MYRVMTNRINLLYFSSLCRLLWHPVLDASIGSNLTSINATSRELQLLLERKRLPALGINSYEFHQTSGKIIFQACNSLYMCLDTGFNVNIKIIFNMQENTLINILLDDTTVSY